MSKKMRKTNNDDRNPLQKKKQAKKSEQTSKKSRKLCLKEQPGRKGDPDQPSVKW